MTKLSEKAARINFEGLDDEDGVGQAEAESTAQSAAAQLAPLRPRKTGVAGITDRINLHHQVQELQTQVATLEKAQVVLKLDPRRVRQSRWKNRHELSYTTTDFAQLKDEIEAAGGNVQPIKVRRLGKAADGGDEYEIVFGRRRLRACAELGFEVAAIVEDMDDVTLFKEMERENRNRADLSPWEQGVMYKDALDAKLFASQRQMAAALNVSVGTLNVAIALASLPDEVVNAFPSPLDLQYRWAAEINAALEKDTARVLTTAQELASRTPRLNAKEVLAALVAAEADPAREPKAKELMAAGRVVGSYAKDAKGGIKVKVKAGVLSAASEKKLVEFIEKLIG